MESAINDNPQVADFDRGHRPFKAWALQQDLISLLGADPTWKVDPGDLGVEQEARDDAGNVRGQSYLSRKLRPGLGLGARKITSVALWVAALAVTCVNQWGPIGLTVDSGDFRFTLLGLLLGITLVLLANPLLGPRAFAVFEEVMLIWAIALIAYQCSLSGGAESPYSVWLVFTTFYAAYFMPRRWVNFNTGLAVVVALMPLAYAPNDASSYAFLFASLLAGVIVMMALTVLYSRELARRANRGVKFLALADRLTGVANLRAFEQFTEELAASDDPRFAIAMLDMNGLKGANTVFGYATGDGMVVRLARLMLQASPSSAQVARIGGDEFAVVLPASGSAELAAWREDFDAAIKDHNERIRGRLPQISVAVGTAATPLDGTHSEALLDAADRRMYAQKAPAVSPPYELDTSGPLPSNRLLAAEDEPSRSTPSFGPSQYAFQAGSLWLMIAIGTLAWIVTPQIHVEYTLATAFTCAFAFAVSAIAFAGMIPRYRRIGWRVSDYSTLLLILPGLWITGGWQSPFQLTLIVVIAYYAQAFRGAEVVLRISTVIALYSIAFWGTGPVSPSGQALFATIVSAVLVIVLILQYNARATDRSLNVIRDSAIHDALTGANNLYAFRKDLGAALTEANARDDDYSQRPALIITNLDAFHHVNTQAGHRGGDAILREAFRRLETAVAPSGSKVYRIGGDEFAVLFKADRFSEAAQFAERCKRALAFRPPAHLHINEQIAASVGFSVLQHEMSPEEFVSAVESALAAGKVNRDDVSSNDTTVML